MPGEPGMRDFIDSPQHKAPFVTSGALFFPENLVISLIKGVTMIYDDNGRLILPMDIAEEFEPWMAEALMEVGYRGGTRAEMILATGLPKSLFNALLQKGGAKYCEQFYVAYERAMMLSQVVWENIGKEASAGKIARHAAGTFQFMMKNNFREDYQDEQVHRHEGGRMVPELPEDLNPVDASRRYKELLTESDQGALFD
jgi:hypothetical protein